MNINRLFRVFGPLFKNTRPIQIRYLHHSASQGRFYTNRFYVKKCSSCHALNSLTLVSCFKCSNALADADIRLRSLDHICEVSNLRKSSHPTNLIQAAAGDGNANGAVASKHQLSDLSSFVLYRCFDFTVMLNRSPSALIHMSAFPNGTFYDIKNFRKSHIELITKMRDRCLLVFKDIISGKVQSPTIDDSILKRIRAGIGDGEAGNQAKRINEALSHVVWGFNYPNTHSHVDMHALLPPITCFNLFKAPFFYPLDKVLGDLKAFGRVRNYSPAQMREMNEFDEVMEAIKTSDRSLRELFSLN